MGIELKLFYLCLFSVQCIYTMYPRSDGFDAHHQKYKLHISKNEIAMLRGNENRP